MGASKWLACLLESPDSEPGEDELTDCDSIAEKGQHPRNAEVGIQNPWTLDPAAYVRHGPPLWDIKNAMRALQPDLLQIL